MIDKNGANKKSKKYEWYVFHRSLLRVGYLKLTKVKIKSGDDSRLSENLFIDIKITRTKIFYDVI